MTTTKTNTLVWITLIILISTSYLLAENNFKNIAILIALASIIKFIAVSFQFMEAKKSNKIWQIILSIFAIIYLIAIYFFY